MSVISIGFKLQSPLFHWYWMVYLFVYCWN